MREIWDGTGDADGKAYWTLNNGEMKGRPYVRQRARRALASWPCVLEGRAALLARTVDNDAWMASRNGQTVASVVRDVEDAMFEVDFTRPESSQPRRTETRR